MSMYVCTSADHKVKYPWGGISPACQTIEKVNKTTYVVLCNPFESF